MGGRGGASGFPTNDPGAPGAPNGPQSAAETKDLHELAEYMKNVGIYVNERSLSGQTFENVREAAAGIERIMTEFPQAAANFHELRGDNLKYGTLACASYSGVIALGNQYYSATPDGLSRTYDGNVRTGFHPSGTTKADITTHEAGHILERALIDKYILSQGNGYYVQYEAAKAWNSSKLSGKIISEACKQVKKTAAGKGMVNADIIKGVSKYATRNRSETLAECVADYAANGAGANPLSVAVWNILKRELG